MSLTIKCFPEKPGLTKKLEAKVLRSFYKGGYLGLFSFLRLKEAEMGIEVAVASSDGITKDQT